MADARPALIGTDPSRRRTVLVRAAVIGLLASHAALSWAGRPTGIETASDDGRYVMLARELSHGSYAEPWRVAHVVHAIYPPGYPALLAGWGGVFGYTYGALAVLSVLASTLALGFTYRAAASLISPAAALSGLAALAFNPHLINSAGYLLSEPVFTLLTVAALLLLGGRASGLRVTSAAALAILAALTRTAGVTLVLALGAHLLVERRFRALAVFTAAATLTVGLWGLHSAMPSAQQEGASYVSDALALEAGRGPAAQMLERVASNARSYVTRALPYRLPLPTIPGTPIDNALGVLVVTVGLAVGAARTWRRWRIAVLYVGTYFGLLLVWTWVSGRFMMPVLPLVVPMVLAGWEWLAGRAGRWAGTAAVVLLGATLAINGGWRVSGYISQRLTCRTEPAPPEANSCLNQTQADFFAAARYAKERLPRNAIVLGQHSSAFYYYSGLRSTSYTAAISQDSLRFLNHLRTTGAEFILLSYTRPGERRHLAPLVRANCAALRVEAPFPPTALLLRVPAPEEPDTAGACAAVEAYLLAVQGPVPAVLDIESAASGTFQPHR